MRQQFQNTLKPTPITDYYDGSFGKTETHSTLSVRMKS